MLRFQIAKLYTMHPLTRRTLPIITSLFIFLISASTSFAAPSINNISDNRQSYPNSQIPKYHKFESTFQINNTVAKNYFLPFSADAPPGIEDGIGISVTGIFTSPNGQQFKQPGFYYQQFEDQVKSNKSWFYPTSNYSWKIRFSPNIPGTWKYKITVTDDSGTTESNEISFAVTDSAKPGFIKVSADPRYFEYDNGTYFPALGFNLNAGNFDIEDPVIGNQLEFEGMAANNIQFSRFWLTQKYIYGAAWSPWRSVNPDHQHQEPNPRLNYPGDPNFTNAYPSDPMPQAAKGSEVYWWLNADPTGAGNTSLYTPCLLTGGGWNLARIAAKKNTNYRIRVRYHPVNLNGNFEVIHWSSINPDSQSCIDPNGTVIAASYSGSSWTNTPDPENPGWIIVSGTFTSGNVDFFNPIYISIASASSGHVFVDYVWLEEDLGGGQYGENLIYKPWAAQHYYVNERNAYAFDKALEYAETKGITFKPVILEKNDILWRFFEFDGSLSKTPYKDNEDLFYGNGRETNGKTKTRYLHEAWWRYLQARWGYSTSIHSWELLNEGPSGPADNTHWILTDVLGKYMGCTVFGVNAGNHCTFDHPNDHLISTSMYGGGYAYHLWNNTQGKYPDVDFADIHDYARNGKQANPPVSPDPGYFDAAEFAFLLGELRGAKLPNGNKNHSGASKPLLRGETAWAFDKETDIFQQNATDGLWLHNMIWAGVNYTGVIEQFWLDAPGRCHIYNLGQLSNCPSTQWDHRVVFGRYYQFIHNIPLNNNQYIDSGATANNSNIRVYGQKDLVNKRAHLWIQNKNHTWKNVHDGISVNPVNATITLPGFSANQTYAIEWWNTRTGAPDATQGNPDNNITANSSGELIMSVNQLTKDAAVKIGNYANITPPPTNPPQSPTPTTSPTPIPPPASDLDGDGDVDIIDFGMMLLGFGENGFNIFSLSRLIGEFGSSQ